MLGQCVNEPQSAAAVRTGLAAGLVFGSSLPLFSTSSRGEVASVSVSNQLRSLAPPCAP